MKNATKTVGYLAGWGFLCFCAVVILAGPGPVPRSEQHGFGPSGLEAVMQPYGSLPRSFEANEGQADRRVKFLSRGTGYHL